MQVEITKINADISAVAPACEDCGTETRELYFVTFKHESPYGSKVLVGRICSDCLTRLSKDTRNASLTAVDKKLYSYEFDEICGYMKRRILAQEEELGMSDGLEIDEMSVPFGDEGFALAIKRVNSNEEVEDCEVEIKSITRGDSVDTEDEED